MVGRLNAGVCPLTQRDTLLVLVLGCKEEIGGRGGGEEKKREGCFSLSQFALALFLFPFPRSRGVTITSAPGLIAKLYSS